MHAIVLFELGKPSSPTRKPVSNKILVQKLPPSYNEERLQMVFDNEKDQGGGPVRDVCFNGKRNAAIVEFENTRCKSSYFYHVPTEGFKPG